MKKILTLCLVAMMAVTTAKAQVELGAIVGGLNGASAKFWLDDASAIQADLAVGLTQAAAQGGSFSMWDFTLNPNYMYHFGLAEGFDLYAGGGVNIGMASPLGWGGNYLSGKFGINGVVGVDYFISGAPIVLALDFRPGYGMLFADQYQGSFFDWKLAFAVRYTL